MVKLARICCMLLLMATLSARAAEDSIEKLAQDPRCARALDWIDRNVSWSTEQQIRITEIPAPEMAEGRRAEYVKKILEGAGWRTSIDRTGNVIAEKAGSDRNSVVLLAAHLDTVFPPGTDVHVKRDGDRLEAPGISDNSAGLSAIVTLARAMAESRISTTKTIVLAADVGEEGEGNLRGIRALVDFYGSRLAAVIAIDGASTDHITTQGIASRRFEIEMRGPGGHSWSDFGVPNPITAVARGIVRFSATSLPEDPRSSYNFGMIEGGTSVNSIPARAAVKIDLRSEDERELDHMESALREAMQAGAKEEGTAMQSVRPGADPLEVNIRSLGSRPTGKLPADSALLETVRNVERYLGNRPRLERSSTDANIPLSMGIPAVALGAGGRGGGSHTFGEWYEPAGRELGLKRLLLITVAVAGVQP
jgi:tripeptide aminopeptidase